MLNKVFNKGIVPYCLCKDAALLFLLENGKDFSVIMIQSIVKEKGIEQAIWEVCGLDPDTKDDKIIHDLILAAHRDIVDHGVELLTDQHDKKSRLAALFHIWTKLIPD